MSTVLKYPKKLFAKHEVMKEKGKMGYPEFWKYSSTKTAHQLTFKPPKNKLVGSSVFGIPVKIPKRFK